MAETTGSTLDQYLTFALDEDIYALHIASVREVLELTTLTAIPKTPWFMRGIINLRGHAVPVVEIRRKFGMERIQDTVETCVIIVETVFGEGTAMMGALVDSVREVVDLREIDVEEAPTIGTAIKPEFIHGMSRIDGKFVTILDIDNIFSAEELAEFGAEPLPQATSSQAEDEGAIAAQDQIQEYIPEQPAESAPTP